MKQAKANTKVKRLFVLALAIVMTCTVSSIHVLAETADYSVSTFSEFQTAISSAPADGTKCTIKIITDVTFDSTLLIPAGTNIKIISDGSSSRTLTQTKGNTRHFTVSGSLTLENIILDGNSLGGGVAVNNGALTMNDGAVITKCYPGSGGVGCGIALRNSTFTMNGGEISYNRNTSGYGVSGGGIYLAESTAEMKGGAIHHNASTWGGGIEISIDSTFTMNDGEIYSNEATTESGGGVHVYVHGTFVMNGGKIYKNTATNYGAGGGVFAGQGSHVSGEPTDWCNFTMNSGTIEDNESYIGGGVGVCWNGNFEMNDGFIRNNTAQAGGGVVVGLPNPNTRVSFLMKNGEVSGNRAASNYGGGIFVYGNKEPVDVQIGEKSGNTGTTPVIRGNTANTQGGGIFIYQAAATMQNGTIAGNTAGSLGGGVSVYSGSTFTLDDGIIGGDTAADANVTTGSSGGGISTYGSGNTFTMTNGRVIGNEAKSSGGGIYIGASDTATITAGDISNNAAVNHGGGIYIDSSASSTISDAAISNNKADNDGGGIYNKSSSTTISNVTIRENTAISGGGVYTAEDTPIKKTSIIGNSAGNGGGVYVPLAVVLTVSDGTTFSGNRAEDEGGGIYTENYTDYSTLTSSDYQNIRTDDTTTFTNNTAKAAYEPPAVVYDYANIKYRMTSIIKADNSYMHPINNYDINFVSGIPYVLYTVTYDANGGTGGHQDSGLSDGSTYTVLSNDAAGISYDGYAFTGWNTEADGSGTPYKPEDTFTVTKNVTLYAQWTEIFVSPPTDDYTNLFIWIFLLSAAITTTCIIFTVKYRSDKKQTINDI